MFVIPIYLRLALIGIFLIGGIALAFLFGFWYSFPLILVGIVLLAGYLLLGTIQSTGVKLQAMDFDGAEKQLSLTKFPNLLFKPNRGYFYLLHGMIAMQKKAYDSSIDYLEKAKALDLPTDNDRATVDFQLANLHAQKGRWPKAKALYKDLQNYSITEPQLKAQIAEFGKALKQSGNLRSVGNRRQMMQQPSGKRRRPKIK